MKKSRKGAPGVIEVAKRAGVSPATVSRYFNTPDLLKPETCLKVQNAAEALGYLKSSSAMNESHRFTGTIGLVVPTIDNAIFAEVIEAFATRLRELDLTLLIAAHGYDLSEEVGIVRSLLARKIDGVVVVGFEHSDVAMRMLSTQSVPVLSIWNYQIMSALPCIGCDNVAAGEMAARALVDMGHTEIALLFPSSLANDRASDRRQGALNVLAQANLIVQPDWAHDCPYDLGYAKQIAKELLSQTPRPKAFLCGNDVIAHGVMLAAQALEIKIPAQLSIVGIGDFRGSAEFEPGLTTVRFPAKRIGIAAADRISKASYGTWESDSCQLIPHRWVERGSLALAE